MFCKYCGSKVEENSRFCPNCGHEIEVEKKEVVSAEFVEESTSIHKTTTTDSKEDTYALIGFILAIAAFFTGITWLPGLILSILGRKSVKNKGMATAGIILSIIPLVIVVIFFFFIIFALLIGAAASGA